MRCTTTIRAGVACSLTCIIALASAAPAFATAVSVEGDALRVIDSAAEPNVLEVRAAPASYDVFDDGAVLVAGAGCVSLGPHYVSCAAAPIRKLAIDGGRGDDVIVMTGLPVPVAAVGGEGDDYVEGGNGGDLLYGGPGDDSVHGGPGDDTIIGTGGDDLLEGEGGGDRISGGDDADIVAGEAGSGDVLNGGDGPDLLRGGQGDDTLNGGAGADALVTGTGTDEANPGGGSDRIYGTAADDVTCNPGDKVSVASTSASSRCGRLPRGASEPQIWPPPPGSVATPSAGTPIALSLVTEPFGVRAATRPVPAPRGRYAGLVLQPRNARTIAVRIPSIYNQPVEVRVMTYRSADGRNRAHAYTRSTTARHWVQIPIEGPRNGVVAARIHCCPVPPPR